MDRKIIYIKKHGICGIQRNITTLPLEILERITLGIKDIYDLENWLTCAYRLADIESVQIQRQELTIGKERRRNTRAELLFNTKFAGTNEKRRGLHGAFNNHLLVNQHWKKEFCLQAWFDIESKEAYETFMNKYRTIWAKQDLNKSTRTTRWKKEQKEQKARKKARKKKTKYEYRAIWVKQDPNKVTTNRTKKKKQVDESMTTWEKKQKAQKTKKRKKHE